MGAVERHASGQAGGARPTVAVASGVRNQYCHLVIGMQVLLAKLEALTGTEAAAQSMQQYEEMYR